MSVCCDHKSSFVKGVVQVGKSTKRMLRDMKPHLIAVLQHRDLDETAAKGLLDAQIIALINTEQTMSGDYPAKGGLLLLQAGVPIFEIEQAAFACFTDHMEAHITPTGIYAAGKHIPYSVLTHEKALQIRDQSQRRLDLKLHAFIDNTLRYAQFEKDIVFRSLPRPPLFTLITGRHVLLVTRGSRCWEDLPVLQNYIASCRPVLVGVDGGADVLMNCGHTPHIIVGDMDSVSDRALHCGAELLVHAYTDGRAPGLRRVLQLGLQAELLRSPGTSEDAALLLAYENKAELIVTVGAQTHMIDFLEKGRRGMSSTMLVRMKLGDKLIDAKGISLLVKTLAQGPLL